ncbi:hypothetical protein JCM1840_001209 [Sporobolomyces johnsonii]
MWAKLKQVVVSSASVVATQPTATSPEHQDIASPPSPTKSGSMSARSATSAPSSPAQPSNKRANSTAASSSAAPSPPKKRLRRMSGLEKEVNAAQAEAKPVTKALERMLGSETQSRSFGRLTITLEQEPIRKGDIVTVHEPGWLAVVDDVRALHSDLFPIIDDATGQPKLTKTGDTRMSGSDLYLLGSWLWSKSDLKALTEDNDNAWSSQCEPMGPNEKVKTDHRQWHNKTALGVPSSGPELVYIFDDAYPAASPSSSTSERSPHPLSHYSTPQLATLCPSPYASPSFSYAGVPCKPGTNLARLHPLPDYYFAVYPLRDIGRSGAVEGKKDDGRRAVPYIRTGFSFEKQERMAEDEDEGGGERGQKTGKGKGGKAKKKVWPLTFNLHSLPPGRPYDPRSPQHFSRASQTWYDVADLQAGAHFRALDDETDAEESTKPEKAGAMGTKRNGTGKDKEKVKSRAPTTALGTSPVGAPVSSRSFNHIVEVEIEISSRSSTTTPLARRNPGSLQSAELIVALRKLAQSPIVRGGAYGLTGNAYLVTRAAELVEILAPPASPTSASSSSAAAAADAAAESRALLTSAAKWEREVDDRENGVGEGKGLGKAWRERGRAPEGCRWVCPATGAFI